MSRSEVGEVLNGYRILEPFRIAGGGNCEWTFAARGTDEYFLKRFFSPKYPVERNGRPPAGNWRARRDRCEEWCHRQRQLLDAAAAVAGAGGRLVVPVDLFREDSHFYKVSPKVDIVPLSLPDVAMLRHQEKAQIMISAATALHSLQRAQIVHGDLSPANILLSRNRSGDKFVARVIDFDSSFLEADPLPPDDTMGNPPYYSPELLTYLQSTTGDRPRVTTRSDVFALGIVFWEYLTGARPAVPHPYSYCAEAVRAGRRLRLDDEHVPTWARVLVAEMLSAEPSDRPSLAKVVETIKRAAASGGLGAAGPESSAGRPSGAARRAEPAVESALRAAEESAPSADEELGYQGPSRVRARGFGTAERAGSEPAREPEAGAGGTSRLRGIKRRRA